jgi:hypothetical protein
MPICLCHGPRAHSHRSLKGLTDGSEHLSAVRSPVHLTQVQVKATVSEAIDEQLGLTTSRADHGDRCPYIVHTLRIQPFFHRSIHLPRTDFVSRQG